MNQDFKTYEEMMRHVEEVIAIDLLQEVISLDIDPWLSSLIDPVEGIYIVGSIDPIVSIKDSVFYKTQAVFDSNGIVDILKSTRISNFKEALKGNDDIVNQRGTIVISRKDFKFKSKFFKVEPTIPAIAIKAATAVVVNYLNSLCRNTRVGSPKYRLEHLVKDEHHDILDDYTDAFVTLIDKVYDFIGKDTWNHYYCYLKGTTLFIEKHIDSRIFEWYEAKFKREAEALERIESGIDGYIG